LEKSQKYILDSHYNSSNRILQGWQQLYTHGKERIKFKKQQNNKKSEKVMRKTGKRNIENFKKVPSHY
jgi:hypothetical protein